MFKDKPRSDTHTTSAYLYAIGLLARRDYSEVKLRQKLRSRKYLIDEIDEALFSVKDKGYLKEENYIEARIKGFMHKNCSPFYIQAKLSEESLDVSLSTIYTIFEEYGVTPEKQIDILISKKLPTKSLDNLDYDEYDKIRTKVIRYILGKGHNLSDIKAQLGKVLIPPQ